MATARLKFDGQEIAFGPGPASVGRTGDNTLSFPDNANVSRNHASIEFRDGSFWLKDLGSSNGTAVNGVRIDSETEIFDGDYITLGNSVILQFFEDEREEESETAPSETKAGAGAGSEAKSSKMPMAIGLAGAVGGLAVVFAAAAAYVALSGPSSTCTNAARIVGPRSGDMISKETDVRVEVTDPPCAQRVIVVLNNKTLAEFDSEPYEMKLDPNKHPELADGRYYQLQVVLVGSDGNEVAQASRIELGFETREVETPTPTVVAANSPTPTPAVRTSGQLSLDETRTMAINFVRKFPGRYNLSNPEFLKAVRDRSAEYATAGYFQRAAVHRDTINQYFVREKTLPPSLGFILAMSQSKFDPTAKGQNLGLWQMSNDFVTVNAYNVLCENFNLADPGQQCAARVAAYYTRDIVDAFDGDIVYAAAAFGKTAAEADAIKKGLPADHADFWKSLPDPAMREQVARFFAAAIVAENPQRFKLSADRPISELYPTAAN